MGQIRDTTTDINYNRQSIINLSLNICFVLLLQKTLGVPFGNVHFNLILTSLLFETKKWKWSMVVFFSKFFKMLFCSFVVICSSLKSGEMGTKYNPGMCYV